jgi:hypothetical protein
LRVNYQPQAANHAHHAAYLANSAEMQDGVGANVTMVPVFRATGASRGGCRELELYGIGLRTKRAIRGTPERPVELFCCYVAADHERGTDHHQVLPAAELHRKVRGLHGDVDELQFWADEERGDSDGPACVARLRRQMSCTRVRMPGSDRCWRCLKQQRQQWKGDARPNKNTRGVGRVRLAPGREEKGARAAAARRRRPRPRVPRAAALPHAARAEGARPRAPVGPRQAAEGTASEGQNAAAAPGRRPGSPDVRQQLAEGAAEDGDDVRYQHDAVGLGFSVMFLHGGVACR